MRAWPSQDSSRNPPLSAHPNEWLLRGQRLQYLAVLGVHTCSSDGARIAAAHAGSPTAAARRRAGSRR